MLNKLFSPFKLKTINAKNRIIMAPMTRKFSPDGVPGQNVAEYYARRAKHGVGLIVTEGTVIDRPASKMSPTIPNFYGDEALNGWKNVAKSVHDEGGLIAPQIWHVGNVKFDKGYEPGKIDSPSGLFAPEKPNCEAMSDADIADTIAAFAKSAKAAKDLGFDAVEIHGAHGYLIDQFFWSGTNIRTDKWGGQSIGERTRFAAEIIKACRAAVGEDFALMIRVSQWKQQDYAVKLAQNPQELENWLMPLVDAGADILHCSQRRIWEAEFEGSELNFAGWAKKLMGVPTISVGSVGLSGEFIGTFMGQACGPQSIEGVLKRLDDGEFDLLAVGRALLNDPEWVEKIQTNRLDELKPFETQELAVLY